MYKAYLYIINGELFYIQVVSAKVVAKAQSKARFGYVTLATREQAQKCILELNGTELKGSTIHVELVSLAL